MRRIQLPRNAFPNIFSPILEILSVALWMFSLLIASLCYLCLLMADIRHACEHGPYSQLLLESSHSRYYRSVPVNRDIVPEHLLLTHDNDIWSPKLYEHSSYLQYGNSCDNLPYCKTKNFIETKVTAIKLRGFNQF